MNAPPFHSVIVGAGGVGGWFGGLLLEKGLKVSFVARGKHGLALKEKGLTLLGDEQSQHFNAIAVYDEAKDIPHKVDMVLLATKLGELEAVSATLSSPCLKNESLIIPLQNGIDAHDMVTASLPSRHRHSVGWGTAHIVAFIERAGVIRKKGTLARFFIQTPKECSITAHRFMELCQQHQLPVRYHDDLQPILWNKFIFLTSFSGITTLTQKNLGAIRKDEHDWRLFCNAMTEAERIAEAEGVTLPASMGLEWQKRVQSLPDDYDSSMARDARENRPLELEWLSGRVSLLGKKHAVPTPTHDLILSQLKK